MQIHPAAQRLPFDRQGPFVTTGDGGVLCFDAQGAYVSQDEGITWETRPLIVDPTHYQPSTETALLRTRQGTVIAAWINLAEKQYAPGWQWGGGTEVYAQWILPLYVSRSHDDGRTWDEPILLNRPWCGCVHSIIQTPTGRIVLVGQEIIPAWRHATVMFLSDDEGATWQRSNVLDVGQGAHDHAGTCEGTVIARRDGSLYLLLRNETGFLYEATSRDYGLTWIDLQPTKIPTVTCCPQMLTLADGTVALLWNAPPRYDPAEPVARDELSLTISTDEGTTWGTPVVVAADYDRVRDLPDYIRASYPYLYERHPGELWITTMYGDVRIKIDPARRYHGTIPLPPLVVLFGDSTTARRPAEVKSVYAQHLQKQLVSAGLNHVVANRGVPADNTDHAMGRFADDVLALHPGLVVIQFGLNDAAVDVWQNPPATGPRVSRERYVANLRSMVQTLRERNVAVVLMTPNRMYWSPALLERYSKPPYDPANPESFNQLHLDAYVAAMRQLALEENVPLVDINQAYLESENPRGLLLARCLQHPSDAGHRLVADLLSPVVIKLLLEREAKPE
ncbi:MAG: exo-alpha-sialidase [Cephaloticoccus sp.]|nr:exo-alpha-sialidase [Cephaloticoccus sp.]MCF7760754.1 exo-alpha-sialidase [Cephaloticoccus sp.]